MYTAHFDILKKALVYLKDHWVVLSCLGLIAGLGRVAQLGGFGDLPTWINNVLEIIVEGSRLGIFLFILGASHFGRGLRTVLRLFQSRGMFIEAVRRTWLNLKMHWASVLLSLIGFSAIAAFVNLAIDQLAYETCLLISLKGNGLLAAGASEWTILLFFKNILVIPFTLVFETLLILWLADTGHTSRYQTS